MTPWRRRSPVRRRRSRRTRHTILAIVLCGAAGTLALATRDLDPPAGPYPLAPTVGFHRAGAAPDAAPTCDLDRAECPPVPRELAFARGQTLGGALGELGLEPPDVAGVVAALTPFLDVRRIRPGDRYAVFEEGGEVAALRFTVADEGRVRLSRGEEGWQAEWQPFERRLVGRALSGTIDGSLVAAVAAAGGPPELAYQIAEVLQWDVDFSRDLRRGDRFEVVYDEVLVDGRRQEVGPIWALTLDNGGRRVEAYRFGEDGGYYDAAGRPLEKMFLRSPLKLAHVTSRFTHRRLHPVLKVYRPHWGVDFRAAVGTPVHVTAGGVVTFAGWDRGGGKVVKVRHPNGYLTAYLHLSKFAPGIRPGARVSQGDVVAYSGNTGLSTAPHLDYRVQLDGRWIDPMTLENVPADPIPVAELAAFEAWRDTCRQSLVAGTALAMRPSWEPDGETVQVAAARPAAARAALRRGDDAA
ncbi:MAG TPA: peptidoglycan DD-metalloendopeptidase family protein, partial [Thermoanaerobaculia bacterium]|nr:peptidoglycan DD-metalloendopeptidase family protein [Thermoanaerobaculia bacterium]